MQSTLCEVSDLKYARKNFELSTLLYDNSLLDLISNAFQKSMKDLEEGKQD